jgi:hypothetical protein
MQLNEKAYDQLVQQAWQASQGQQATQGAPDQSGRSAEGGRSGGQHQPGQQAQRFARQLLKGLQDAGCTDIQDALNCAQRAGKQAGH